MTAATAMEAAMKVSDGNEGDGEGRGQQRWWASDGDKGRRQRAMARAARAIATAKRG